MLAMRHSTTILCLLATAICGLSSIAFGDRQSPTMPQAREEMWWHERHRINIERGKQKADVIWLGDSITQLMDDAHDLYQKFWPDHKMENLGIGGDRIQNLLWRISQGGEVDGLHPQLVIVLIGTNNLAFDNDRQVVAGIDAVIESLRRKLPESNILILGLLPRGQRQDPIRARIMAINKSIAQHADGKVVYFSDGGNCLLQSNGDLIREAMPDQLHPSHRGYELIFSSVKPEIDQLLKSR